MSLDRLPPHSVEAEQGALGCLLTPPTAEGIQMALHADVSEAWFYELRHRYVWQAILALWRAGSAIDLITVCHALKATGNLDDCGGPGYVSSLQDSCPSTANLPFYLEILRSHWQRRTIIAEATRAIGAAFEASEGWDSGKGGVDAAIEALANSRRGTSKAKLRDGDSVAREFVDDLERRFQNQGRLQGISYGIPRLDEMTEGLQAGEYVIIGARPSVGKTALALTMLSAMAIEGGVPCAFLTLETNEVGLYRRLVSLASGVPARLLKSGRLSEGDFRRVSTATAKVKAAPIAYINGIGGMNGPDAANAIRKAVHSMGARVAFVDYLQKLKIDGSAEKRTYGIAANSAALDAVAEETGVAVIALAQVNRDSETGERAPKLSDLAESGQIERDADTVLMLHRDRAEKQGEASLLLAKARDGECGMIQLYYDGTTTRFSELHTSTIDHSAT